MWTFIFFCRHSNSLLQGLPRNALSGLEELTLPMETTTSSLIGSILRIR
jgi:hypothetical protein